jgi:hypothetical protein
VCVCVSWALAAGGHVWLPGLLKSSWRYKQCLQCTGALFSCLTWRYKQCLQCTGASCSCLTWCSHVHHMGQAVPLSCAVAMFPVCGEWRPHLPSLCPHFYRAEHHVLLRVLGNAGVLYSQVCGCGLVGGLLGVASAVCACGLNTRACGLGVYCVWSQGVVYFLERVGACRLTCGASTGCA